MARHLTEGTAARLERSCGPADGDWIRIAPAIPGLERAEARFRGHGFDPHRHDTYTVGYTVEGVQSFRYRGTARHSLPGQVFVLHPDELHDGRAGTADGFRYRGAYVDPAAISAALEDTGHALPFVGAAVSSDPRLAAALLPALDDLDAGFDELQRDQILAGLADALAASDPSITRRSRTTKHWRAVNHARALLDANIRGGVASAALEVATGLDRYAIARQFRACLGVSPYRYLTLRRLDRARSLIRQETPLADVAIASGFADQSHLTRQFKKAYGVTPGRWAALVQR
jgi:AraC-like DNA-binding protein